MELFWNVALLTESVDRNRARPMEAAPSGESLSSRRAWIEIVIFGGSVIVQTVALLTESVDRNVGIAIIADFRDCRSPHGERG